jgi:tRNA(fMet)-specific endonuclease VapC
MEKLLVDTDVISYFLKGDSRASRYEKLVEGKQLMVSFMTVAELYAWAFQRKWGDKQFARLAEHLTSYAICPSGRYLCLLWAHVSSTSKNRGNPISCADAWIAATALKYSVPLLTNNAKHFQDIPDLKLATNA